jgi:putative tryptophan/tyrosine transport system substrate-binding protein
MMRRRDFVTLIGGAAVVCPLAARAQQPVTRVRRIAVLLRNAQDDPDAQRDLQNFRKGLWELGWTVGSNILIEYRYANADPAQIQTHAAELVQRFRNSNHIRRPCRACGSRCERQDRR